MDGNPIIDKLFKSFTEYIFRKIGLLLGGYAKKTELEAISDEDIIKIVDEIVASYTDG